MSMLLYQLHVTSAAVTCVPLIIRRMPHTASSTHYGKLAV